MTRADLHMHTRFSDGSLSPEEIARLAAEAGVSLFSVTDHDNMEGVPRAARAAKEAGLLFVSGMEISAYDNGGKVHILGYRCTRNAAYDAFLQSRREGAYRRAEDSLQKANACFGTALTMADVEDFHREKDAPLHTMHVVDAFSRRLGRERGELYKSAFAYDKPAYSGLCRVTPQEAVRFIHAMGGIAFLAHPARIGRSGAEMRELFDDLVRSGLDGIECFHSEHTERESAELNDYAKEKGLLVSGGSDFHAKGRGRAVGMPVFYASDALLKAFFPA